MFLDDVGVVVAMISITVLAIVVVILKVLLFDSVSVHNPCTIFKVCFTKHNNL